MRPALSLPKGGSVIAFEHLTKVSPTFALHIPVSPESLILSYFFSINCSKSFSLAGKLQHSSGQRSIIGCCGDFTEGLSRDFLRAVRICRHSGVIHISGKGQRLSGFRLHVAGQAFAVEYQA